MQVAWKKGTKLMVTARSKCPWLLGQELEVDDREIRFFEGWSTEKEAYLMVQVNYAREDGAKAWTGVRLVDLLEVPRA